MTDLESLMAADAVDTSDKLDMLRALVRVRRDLGAEITDLEERLRLKQIEISKLEHETLPMFFAEAGVDRLGLPAEGNLPPMDAVLTDYYKASIAANWDKDRKQAAYNALEQIGLDDLIAVNVTVSFKRGEQEQAVELAKELAGRGFSPQVARSVHHMALTAALRELCETGHRPAAALIDAIGGFVGKIVKLRKREEVFHG